MGNVGSHLLCNSNYLEVFPDIYIQTDNFILANFLRKFNLNNMII